MRNKKDNNTSNKNLRRKNLIKIVKGSIISIVFSLIFLLVLALLLTLTNMPESVIPTAIIIISAVSIFTGSIFSSMNINKNGILNGGLVGLIYILIIYLLSSMLFVGFSISIKSIIMIVSSVLAGMMGGIVGVNINKK